MYRMNRRVTYSDVGTDYKTDMAQIINYFQDCSCFHSDSLGMNIKSMDSRGKVWIMNGWQIIVERYPEYGEEITVGTWPYDFKGPMGLRNFMIEDAEGNRIAKANSVWVFMDVSAGRPARIDEDMIEAYKMEPREDMDYAGRKIKASGNFERMEAFRVTADCLDTNRHVNNGRFVAMAQEYLPEHFKTRQLRVEYKHSAFHGDILIPKRQIADGKVIIQIENAEGTVCAVIEFAE